MFFLAGYSLYLTAVLIPSFNERQINNKLDRLEQKIDLLIFDLNEIDQNFLYEYSQINETIKEEKQEQFTDNFIITLLLLSTLLLFFYEYYRNINN